MSDVFQDGHRLAGYVGATPAAPVDPARHQAATTGDALNATSESAPTDDLHAHAKPARVRLTGLAADVKTDVTNLTAAQRDQIVHKKATCPFLGSAVARGALPVRNDADKPLASINDVVGLGNSGGGSLGNVLKIFAEGNHAFMPDEAGAFHQPVPDGQFSLDLPGSQGSHPGHSGILQGNPLMRDSGRFSEADFDRLISRAKNGAVKRSDIGKFIAENLVKDPQSKVFGTNVAKLLGGDLAKFVKSTGPALLDKAHGRKPEDQRKAYETLTNVLGEDNLIGSAGEYGLLMAFLVNKPGAPTIDGEPALSVADLTAMFKDKQLPPGWETWPKTATDWVTNTTALLIDAGKEYLHLTHAASHHQK